MIQVLIVDDEKLEREGIKYLLAMEEGGISEKLPMEEMHCRF